MWYKVVGCFTTACLFSSWVIINGAPSSKNDEYRIVGGKPAEPGEFPYQVSLRRSWSGSHFCGGAIITPTHILTAGHCLFYIWGGILPPVSISVLAGQIELALTKHSINVNVSRITVHEEYVKDLSKNDIGIIEVAEELPTASNLMVMAVPLRKSPANSGITCFVSGWGYESYQEDEGGIEHLSDELQVTDVKIVPFSKCKEMYEGVELYDGMMCAGQLDGGKDACQGDSGGPLVCEGLLTGIISTGDGCGDARFPGIYSDVEYYYNWIQNVVSDTSQLSTTTVYEFSSSTSSVATSELTEPYTTSTVSTGRTSTEIIDTTTSHENDGTSSVVSMPIILILILITFVLVV